VERDQGNTSSGDDWIDDVLSRALEKSYNDPPKFDPDEKKQISTTDTSASSEGSPTNNRLPYPDENTVPKIEDGDDETTTSERKARTALEWLVVIVGAYRLSQSANNLVTSDNGSDNFFSTCAR